MRKSTKKILYFLFSFVIVVASIIFVLEFFGDSDKKQKEVPPPSIIEVPESEKIPEMVESETIRMAPDVDFNEERRKYNNNDIIARLEIPGLINVLIVKGTNNQYYLKHDLRKDYDYRGSEFLDYRLTPTSKQVNIYGHNSRDENSTVAFLKLQQFLDYDFFENNKYIILQYEGGKSIYKIKAIKEVSENGDREHMFVDYTGDAFLNHVNKMTTGDTVIYSRDVEVNQYSNIIVLQTCSYHLANHLYTFIGVKIN